MNTCEFHWHEDLEAENAKLRAEIERLTKNDYTEYSCVVCLTGIRARESRCEEGGVWYHPLCKVAKGRDDALLQNCETAEIIKRNRSWLISMAGLDAGLTDYSLRHDLLRLLELADALKTVVEKQKGGA